MPVHQRRTLCIAGIALLGVWLVAGAGWFAAHRAKATAEKVAAYLHENDLARMPEEKRARALSDLSEQIAELPVEERRRARMDEGWAKWFSAMSDAEKRAFVEATMPAGVKQMVASFEKLPEDRRRKAVNDALRELRKAREAAVEDGPSELRLGTNRPPALSEELQRQVIASGLKVFLSESSPQTQAELAPLLEELQRLMENGRFLQGQRR